MFAVQYDPELHSLQDLPIAGYLRRELSDDLVFTYRHRRSLNFVIAAWVDKPMGEMLELAILREGMDQRDVVNSIRSMKKGSTDADRDHAKLRTTMAQLERRHDAAIEEAQRTEEDVDQFLHRRFTKHGNGKIQVPAYQEEKAAEARRAPAESKKNARLREANQKKLADLVSR